MIKYLDKDISKYLTESEEAINFYYTVEEKSTGIKISFAIIYVIVVSVLLFVSISIAIRFSSRFFRSINNLINASVSIGEGKFDTKVPEVKTDKDLEILNKKLNLGLKTLKNICGIESSLNTYHLGYVLGPRINAAGRVGDSKLGASLLINDRNDLNLSIAERLNYYNQLRKKIEKKV